MFALVNDIERYPEFMPGCIGSEILAKGEGWLEAKLRLSRMGIEQSFATHNTLEAPHSMAMTLKEGPFKSMRGEWKFQALNEKACKIEFWLEIEFPNAILALTLPKFFEQNASEQVDAVCQRAKILYS